MTWTEAEATLRALIEAQWPLTDFAALKLVWENEVADYGDRYMAVDIEGFAADKTIYGSPGKRSSVEHGVIFFHAFVPVGRGKALALNAVHAMTTILELQTQGGGAIRLDGGNPPSPIESRRDRDWELSRNEPGGMYYRCSGSVPFIVIGSV